MSKQELLVIIERKRTKLIEIVKKNGLGSAVTIQFSQELDKLLNELVSLT